MQLGGHTDSRFIIPALGQSRQDHQASLMYIVSSSPAWVDSFLEKM